MPRLIRIPSLFAVLLCLMFLSSAARSAEPASRPPNIVFVLLDNVGKDWFRCYGSEENQTPVIDQLTYNGLKFRNFYVTPVCSTSRTMLLTGRYPFRTGWHTHHDAAIYGGGYLDWNAEICFSRVLKNAGYATGIAGKWQVNDLFDPAQADAIARHGFDEYCLFPEGKPGHPAHKKRYWDAYIVENGQRLDTAGRFGPDVVADFAADFMRRHKEEPFLLYYPMILTHIPVTTTPLTPDENATPRQQFAGMLRYADHLVGRLIDSLDQLGLRDNTLVFITADNGTDNGTDQNREQSLGGRINGVVSQEGIYSLTERGINVPFIVTGPKWIPQGRESDALINAADILPTFAELAGAKLPAGVTIDGQSFASVIRDGSDAGWTRPWTFTQYGTRRVIRDQRFKLYSTGELYDLAADPLEQHDLSSSHLDADVAAGRNALQTALNRQPADAKWPFAFRSISARKMRAAADAPRRAKWIKERHAPLPDIAGLFEPPERYRGQLGSFPSPLNVPKSDQPPTREELEQRRAAILKEWQDTMGPWPELIAAPRFESVAITRRENITQRQLRIELGLGGEMVDAFMLVPDGDGPFPAVLVPYYDAQTGAGYGTPLRDFGWQLARRGFVTLSIGKPNSGVNLEDPKQIPQKDLPYFGPVDQPVRVQPLSALAYAAANAHTFLAHRPEVYPDRIGVVGHSFGGKWALFASCLYDKFDCAVWSDPGVVFDETEPNVNYWDIWYLGAEPTFVPRAGQKYKFRGPPGDGNPRTGAYKQLIAAGRDLTELHALMAPRPFLVSGGTADGPERWTALNSAIELNRRLGYKNRVAMSNRPTHSPTEESNEQVYRFFEWWLMEKTE